MWPNGLRHENPDNIAIAEDVDITRRGESSRPRSHKDLTALTDVLLCVYWVASGHDACQTPHLYTVFFSFLEAECSISMHAMYVRDAPQIGHIYAFRM